MKRLSRPAMAGLAALTAATTLAATATTASAAVACNRDGECWRVPAGTTFKPSLGITVRSDAWWSRQRRDQFRWRNARRGAGFYSHGVWRPL